MQREVYEAHYRRIYNTCLRIIGNAMEAEEAMQDTFLKIFESRQRMHDEAKFYGWSKRIAVNTAIDRVRKRRLVFEPADRLQVVEEEPTDEQALQLSVEKVKKTLAALPDGYRVVVSMHLFEGFDFEEIAEILKVKEVSVRSQFSRGRQKLIEMIKTEHYGSVKNIY